MPASPAFGAGGDEPYARALTGDAPVLALRRPGTAGLPGLVGVRRFLEPADEVDLQVLDRVRGAVLDVGCGPGRMVAAAIRRGHAALGVDVSDAAVELARSAGLPVLHRSVFDLMPAGHTWATVLLLDGNVGIGGGPAALLARCVTLLAPGGNLLVEVDPEPGTDLVFAGVLTDDAGHASDPFHWAELGLGALLFEAEPAGLFLVATWSAGGRTFAELDRAGHASIPG